MKKCLKSLSALIIGIAMLTVSAGAQTPQDKNISGTSVSPEFYSAVAAILKVSPDSVITADQLVGITGQVKLENDGLCDTRGLSLFTGASSIDLWNNTITQVSQNAFRGMKNLETVILPSTVTEIGDGAFFGDSSFLAIGYQGDILSGNMTISPNITAIGADAFNGTASSEINIGECNVGARAFANEKSLAAVNLQYGCPAAFDSSAFSGDSVTIEDDFTNDCDFAQNMPNVYSTYKSVDFKGGFVTLDVSKTGNHSINLAPSQLNFTDGVKSFNIRYDVKKVIYTKTQYVNLNKNQEWDGGAPITYPDGVLKYGQVTIDRYPKNAEFFNHNPFINAMIYRPKKNYVGTDEIDWTWSNGANTFSGKIILVIGQNNPAAGGTNTAGKIANPKTGGTEYPAELPFCAAAGACIAVSAAFLLKKKKTAGK